MASTEGDQVRSTIDSARSAAHHRILKKGYLPASLLKEIPDIVDLLRLLFRQPVHQPPTARANRSHVREVRTILSVGHSTSRGGNKAETR